MKPVDVTRQEFVFQIVSVYIKQKLSLYCCFIDHYIVQTALRHVLFPVGGMYKKEVKRIASAIGLDRIANKDESMGICFIGSRRFKSFINDYIVPTPGLAGNRHLSELVFHDCVWRGDGPMLG